MDRDHCSARDVLADIWGPLSPRKRKSIGDSPIKIKSPKHGNERVPLSPSKFNIDQNVDPVEKRKVSRNLFESEIVPEKIKALKTKIKVETPKKARPEKDDLFGAIKAALSLECPTEILGREKEKEKIENFIDGCFKKGCGKGLYISGVPGTGKSATINNVLKSLSSNRNPVFVNCMSVENSTSIYPLLLEKFNTGIKIPKTTRWQKQKLHQFVQDSSKPMNLLVLDEMDQLNSKNEEVLYDLFEIASAPNSRMVLIGIANGLDLLDRVLPNLSRTNHPDQLNFIPYKAAQITTLIKARLTPEMLTKVEPTAIMMCAKRVAALAGDARKALDVLRRATEIAGSKKAAKVGISHVNDVLNKTYTDRSAEEMPFQQQLVIIGLIKLARQEKIVCTITEILRIYKSITTEKNLPKVTDPELKDAVELLVQSAIITKVQKTKKSIRYQLSMNEEDAAAKISKGSKLIALLSQ